MQDHQGVIDFWNDTGGYGFIESPASDEDVFFHGEDSVDTGFSEGDAVEFDIKPADKGPRAVNLRKAGADRTLQSQSRSQSQQSSTGGRTSSSSTDGASGSDLWGTVDFFNDTGGYGFIETSGHDEDVFFHMEDIGGPSLTEGTNVTFRIEESDKGPRAVDVRRGHISAPSSNSTTSGHSSGSSPEQTGDTQVYDSGDDTDQTGVYDPDGGASADDGSTTMTDSSSPTFCPYCGTDLSGYPDGAFCPDCGEEL